MLKVKWYALVIILLLSAGCGSSNSEKSGSVNSGDVVATINNYDITLSEFNAMMKFESEVDPEFQITMGSRKKFLDYLIQKQLYIQEASKLKLDQKEAFVRSIEKYWESTLIRQLLDLKTREFKEKVLVTREDTEAFYKKNKDYFNDQPLESVAEEIRKAVTAERVAQMNRAWTEQLRSSAKIKIKDTFLEEASSGINNKAVESTEQ